MRNTLMGIAIFGFLGLLVGRVAILGTLWLACWSGCSPGDSHLVFIWFFTYSMGFFCYLIAWWLSLELCWKYQQRKRFISLLGLGGGSLALIVALRLLIPTVPPNSANDSLLSVNLDTFFFVGGSIWMLYFLYLGSLLRETTSE